MFLKHIILLIMGLEMSPFTVLVFPFLVLVLVLFVTKQRNKSNNNRVPPGPPKFPFIGNLHLLMGSQPPHRALGDLAKKYGPLMQLQLGEIPTLIVSSSEMAQVFMKTHDINFASRPDYMATEILSKGYKAIGFTPYGEYWRQLRKICTLELLSNKRVDSFRPIRENEFKNMCRWIASQSGSVINLTEKVTVTSCDIITLSTLGNKTDQQARYTSIMKQANETATGFSIADVFPSLRFFDKILGLRKKMEGLTHEAEKIVASIIDERRRLQRTTASHHIEEKQEDLLDVLLKLQDDEREPTLTTENIIPILQELFAAGFGSSATAVDWAMSEMLKNPSILKKAQDEVRQVFDGKTQVVDESYLSELTYLKLVIKEIFRMHPPGPLLLPRECREQCTINGYDIPKKTRLMVNAWAISRDPKHWKDPDSFKPERFLDNDVDYKGTNFHFIPFGAGRRICPGVTFGLINVELPLAMLLYHFDWILPEGMKPEEMDMTEVFGITATRKSKLHIVPVIRRPVPEE